MKKTIYLAIILVLIFNDVFGQTYTRRRNNKQVIDTEMRKKAEQYNLGDTKIPKDSVRMSSTGGGRYLEFERGVVYYNPKLKQAFATWGKIFDKFATQNWEHGFLGFPTSDYTTTPSRVGAFQHFDNGSIYYSQTSGAHFMKGWFKDHWANLGWEKSPLGFPTTDELDCNKEGYTIYQNFEYGSLFVGENKKIIQSNSKKATAPTDAEILAANPPPPPAPTSKFKKRPNLNFELIFAPMFYAVDDCVGVACDEIDLYGFMDVRVYNSDGTEIKDKNNKAYTLFNIAEKDNMPEEGKYNRQNFGKDNLNFKRRYNISKANIDGGAFVRIYYWLHDYDNASGNEHLMLVSDNGKIPYAGVGNVAFREIKIIDLQREVIEKQKKHSEEELGGSYNLFQQKDILRDGADILAVWYSFELINK